MVKTCASCGHPLPPFHMELGLSPTERFMFRALEKAGQAGLTASEMAGHVYGHVHDAAPLTVRNSLYVARCKLRKKLERAGLDITSARKFGSRWKLVVRE